MIGITVFIVEERMYNIIKMDKWDVFKRERLKAKKELLDNENRILMIEIKAKKEVFDDIESDDNFHDPQHFCLCEKECDCWTNLIKRHLAIR